MNDYPVGHPVEEARQMQAGDDQHHSEQQHEGAEVNAFDGAPGRYDPANEHQDGADDRHGWTVDPRAGQATKGEDEITCEKDAPCRNQLPMRQSFAKADDHHLSNISIRRPSTTNSTAAIQLIPSSAPTQQLVADRASASRRWT